MFEQYSKMAIIANNCLKIQTFIIRLYIMIFGEQSFKDTCYIKDYVRELLYYVEPVCQK